MSPSAIDSSAPSSITPSIAAIVLTFNEARHIADCLDTLRWADQQIVFDSYSTDQTITIAKTSGALVLQNAFQNFAQQRNAALTRAETDWVFFVDADERCNDGLATEIRSVMLSSEHPVWSVPRRNYLFGKLTLGAGWYPDYQARLFRIGQASFDPEQEVHEVAKFMGSVGYLHHELTHYNYASVAQFHQKQRYYAQLAAGILYKKGVRTKPRNYLLQPPREFHRRFISLRGYVDGWHGLRLCLLLAYYNLDMYRRLTRLWQEHEARCSRYPS